jgi:hypothetical protein
MITDPKTLLDMGFNAAICCSFAIPGAGPAVAGVLAGTHFLFDVFFPVPNHTDPLSLYPTRSQLNAALADLGTKIGEAMFTNAQTDKSIVLLDQNDGYLARLADVSQNRMPAYLGSAAAQVQTQNWRQDFTSYFDTGTPGGTIDVLNDVTNWVSVHLSHERRTIPLYTYAVGLFVSYCKLGMVWELNEIIETYKQQNDAYTTALKAWNTWNKTDPSLRGAQPVLLAKPDLPFIGDETGMTAAQKAANEALKDTFKKNSIFADKITTYLPGYIKHAQTLIDAVTTDFNDRQAQIDARLAKFSLAQSGSNYFYTDTQTGFSSTPVSDQALAQGQLDIAKGVEEAAIWNALTTKYDLAEISQTVLDTLQKTVDDWKATNAQFT